MQKITQFKNEFEFLSNFYPSPIIVDGKLYKTVEAAFQASKTHDPNVKKLIREAQFPWRARKLGQAVQVRPDWESVKVQIMQELLWKKFENPFLRPLLLATGDSYLEEGNTWNDLFWGVCNGVGENWLGKLLMITRDKIIAENDSV